MESLDVKKVTLNEKETNLSYLHNEIEKHEQDIDILQEEVEKTEAEKAQLTQDKELCKQKLERGIRLLDELKSENSSWIKEVESLTIRMENLLGDALVSAAYITILPPFEENSRYIRFPLIVMIICLLFRRVLKKYVAEQLEVNEIQVSDIEETVHSMIDYTKLEQWKFSGLSADSFFLENAIALTNTKRYKKTAYLLTIVLFFGIIFSKKHSCKTFLKTFLLNTQGQGGFHNRQMWMNRLSRHNMQNKPTHTHAPWKTGRSDTCSCIKESCESTKNGLFFVAGRSFWIPMPNRYDGSTTSTRTRLFV